MAFTTTQLEAVETAIASGTSRVKYADKEVTYASIDDLIKLRNLIRQELGLAPARPHIVASFSKDNG